MTPNLKAILQPAEKSSVVPPFASDALKPMTEMIIGCAIEVHRQLGPGLLEQTYEAALCIELQNAGMKFVRQPVFPVVYKGQPIGESLGFDRRRFGGGRNQERRAIDPIFESQVLTYLRVTGKKVGLLMNFNSRLLRDGIKRYVL